MITMPSKQLKKGYVAYNKMHVDGESSGRRYRVTGVHANAATAKAEAKKSNRRWNKQMGKGRTRAVFLEVKKVGMKRKKPRKRLSLGDALGMAGW